MKQLGYRILSLGVAAVLIGLWQVLADLRVFPPTFLPAPSRTIEALWRGLTDDKLAQMWINTGLRMLLGWLLASIFGIVVGSALSLSRTLYIYVGPTLEFLRPLPASA